MKNRAKTLAYVAFGVVCFVVFFFIQFPFKSITSGILPRIQSRVPPPYSIEASKLGPYWLTGVTLLDFKLRENNKTVFETKKISLRLRILPLIQKTYSVAFQTQTFGGKLSGHVGRKTQKYFGKISREDELIGKINIQKIKVGQIPALQKMVPLEGTFDGALDFQYSMAKINEGKINGKFTLADGKIKQGNIAGLLQLDSSLDLDHQKKPLPIEFKMENGQIKPQIECSNDDGIFSLTGDIQLNPRFNFSQLNLRLSLNFSEKAREKLPASLFDLVLAPGEGSDGTYTYLIAGPLARPSFRPLKM